VIHAGSETFPLAERVRAVPAERLLDYLSTGQLDAGADRTAPDEGGGP